MSILSMVGGALGGQVLGMTNDRRQEKQQGRYNRMQIEGSKELTDYNMKKQLEMWEATGFKGQMKQLNEAGLNAGLIYGMGGAGGQSSNVNAGNAQGGQSGEKGREATELIGMGLQNQLLQAQKENIEADTANKKADTGLKGEQGQEINVRRFAAEMENTARNYFQNVDEMGNNVDDMKDSIEGKIKIAELKSKMQEAVNMEIEGRLKEAGIEVDKATAAKMGQDIVQRAEEIRQKWKGLTLQEREVKVKEELQKFETEWDKQLGAAGVNSVGIILNKLLSAVK
jgi:hypothetical protein